MTITRERKENLKEQIKEYGYAHLLPYITDDIFESLSNHLDSTFDYVMQSHVKRLKRSISKLK
jgi:hypothetical protein